MFQATHKAIMMRQATTSHVFPPPGPTSPEASTRPRAQPVRRAVMGLIIGVAMSLALLTGADAYAEPPVKAGFIPSHLYVVADGVTEYEMALYVDATNYIGMHARATIWWMAVPEYINIIGARLPEGEDFLYDGYFMGTVDIGIEMTHVPGFPSFNRLPRSQVTPRFGWEAMFGPVEQDKLVAIYTFTVSPDAVLFEPTHFWFDPYFLMWYWDSALEEIQYIILGSDLLDLVYHPIIPVTPNITECPGDVNGDGRVNTQDLAEILSAWGTAHPPTDINGDGVVNAQDLAVVLSFWGPCP